MNSASFWKFLGIFPIICVVFANPPNRKVKTQMIEQFRAEHCPDVEPDQLQSSQNSFPFSAIHPAYEEICYYLRIGDLCTVRQVCRALRKAANHVLLTRGPEVAIIPIQSSDSKAITTVIGSEPKLTIFFASVFKLSQKSHDGNAFELYSTYTHRLPRDMLAICIEDALVFYNDRLISSENNDAAALFLPKNPQVEIRSDFVGFRNFIDPTYDSSTFMSNILPSNEQTYEGSLALLLFSESIFSRIYGSGSKVNYDDYTSKYEAFKTSMLHTIKERNSYSPGKIALWGGQVSLINRNAHIYDSAIIFLGVTVFGPKVSAWSKPVKIVSESVENIRRQLVDFKSKIFYKKPSNTIAMATISTDTAILNSLGLPIHYSGELNQIRIFKKVFPHINLIALGIEIPSIKYCIDSTEEVKENAEIQVEYGLEYACLLIITYQ